MPDVNTVTIDLGFKGRLELYKDGLPIGREHKSVVARFFEDGVCRYWVGINRDPVDGPDFIVSKGMPEPLLVLMRIYAYAAFGDQNECSFCLGMATRNLPQEKIFGDLGRLQHQVSHLEHKLEEAQKACEALRKERDKVTMKFMGERTEHRELIGRFNGVINSLRSLGPLEPVKLSEEEDHVPPGLRT